MYQYQTQSRGCSRMDPTLMDTAGNPTALQHPNALGTAQLCGTMHGHSRTERDGVNDSPAGRTQLGFSHRGSDGIQSVPMKETQIWNGVGNSWGDHGVS